MAETLPEDFSSTHMTRVARRLVREVIPTRWRILALSLVCMIGVGAFTGALAYATKFIVDDVFSASDTSAAWRVALLLAGIAVFKAGFQYANEVIVVVMRRGIGVQYQKALFAKTVRMDMAYFAGEQAPTQMLLIRNLGMSSGSAFVGICNKMTVEVITVAALFVVMFLQNPWLTVICSLCVPVIIGLVAWLSAKVRGVATQEAGAAALFFATGAEVFRGIKTVKSYQLEDKSRARFNAGLDQVESLMFRFARITSATLPIVEFLGGLVIGLFVIFASWQVTSTEATAGEFTAFVTAFLMAYKPAERLSDIWVKVQKDLVYVARMYIMLDTKPKSLPYGQERLSDPSAPLSVDGLSFSYGGDVPALKEVSFAFKPGERVAVVGQSGAGKSTLIDLLQRYYDPSAGAVRLGETDLQSLSSKALHDHISFISQDIFLFDGTIADNIRDGRRDASRDEIEAAARMAGLGEVIASMPEGIDTPVGPNGAALSGGQRQRVSIARGIIKRAGLFIFDEITSALDAQTERDVMTRLVKELGDATLLFITHRPATLDYVDRVLVLKEGRVAAFGPAEELRKHNAEFRMLFAPE